MNKWKKGDKVRLIDGLWCNPQTREIQGVVKKITKAGRYTVTVEFKEPDSTTTVTVAPNEIEAWIR